MTDGGVQRLFENVVWSAYVVERHAVQLYPKADSWHDQSAQVHDDLKMKNALIKASEDKQIGFTGENFISRFLNSSATTPANIPA